jgi:hypothetical protein
MAKVNKNKRKSGRYIPKYTFNLPFKIREELDLHEYRTMWDDWIDWRDGMRASWDKLRFKRMMKKTKQYIIKSVRRKIANTKRWD